MMKLNIDGQIHEIPDGCTVAAALARAGLVHTRISETGQSRAAFCGMGQCQECRVRIDGIADRLACMTPAAEGMVVLTR